MERMAKIFRDLAGIIDDRPKTGDISIEWQEKSDVTKQNPGASDFGWFEKLDKPKRSRGKKGRYLADDPTTKDVNEAWVGGKTPKKNSNRKK